MVVSLFLYSVVREIPKAGEITMELHCFLNTFKGYVPCDGDTGLQIKWTADDDTPINGKRFTFDNPSTCFSKLIITKRPTDHHRTWKCHLTKNDEVKTTARYTTTVRGTKLV